MLTGSDHTSILLDQMESCIWYCSAFSSWMVQTREYHCYGNFAWTFRTNAYCKHLSRTLVRELQTLWTCNERLSIYGSLFKRPIKIGLVCVSSDIPAARKIGGSLGHMAAQGCSRCKRNFNSGDGLDFSGFDRDNWQPRNSSANKRNTGRNKPYGHCLLYTSPSPRDA